MWGPVTEQPCVPDSSDVAADRVVRAALSSLPYTSVLLVGPDLRYRAVLGAAVTAHGYDPQAMIGRTVAEVVPPAAFARIGPRLRRALAGETFVDVAESDDGAAVYETTYGPAIEDGVVVGALAVVRDVTVERRALAELAAGDERNHRILGNISDVVALTAADGRISWVSPSTEGVLGWRPDQLLGRTAFEFAHPDDLPILQASRAELLETGGPILVGYRFRCPDSRWRRVESHVRAVHDTDTGAMTGWVVTVRDVTDRRLLEADLARATDLFELSFAAAPIGKALVEPDGRFIKVNPALAALLGRDATALLGTTFQEITHPDDLATDEELLRETAQGLRDGYRMEKRYLRPDGSVVWALLAVSVVRDDDLRPRFFISQIEDISDRKRALQEMERLATTDALTGLPNRLLLMDRLRHALTLARRGGWLVGVIFLDLDEFKQVNDTLGHDAGDDLLRQTAERLTRAGRESDTTTRLGGDEFVVVCEQIIGIDEVARIAERMRGELSRPFTVFGHEVHLSASIGVTAGNSATAEALLAEADRTMYSAKHRRSGRVDVYAEALEVVAHDQLRLHAALREGISRGELLLHYQPILALGTGTVVAREALVRWQHPTLGLLAPAAFLEGADRTHLGILVGEHVITRACADAASWTDDIVVHVNVSARHLAQPGFPRFVSRILAITGLAADRLVLEITESLVLAASPSTLTSAHALTTMGVGLSLDDFGTGYSSVAALNRLPIDSFKIDRSFVADVLVDPTTAALVEGLIGLGSHMDFDVIAEGIESREQAEWLAARGCPHGQGFYFGRPVPLGFLD
jgi:diguanylate cyclase (GGDEF)-like protein/PAS domain S-box-containing protein